ncbi:MAG: hypothetical protein ACON5A_00230 [Candidatus Comchoanobacterales bacterium]
MQYNSLIEDSQLWQLIKAYYDQQGIRAWANNIPFQATNHSGMVYHAARCIQAFAKPYEKVDWMELGAGHGLFSYRISQHLKAPQYHGIVSDPCEQNIAFWQHHPQWQNKNLTFKQTSFDPTLTPKRPSVFIANYMLDCLPFDAISYDQQWHQHSLTVKLPFKHLNKNIKALHQIELEFPKHTLDIAKLPNRWQKVINTLKKPGRWSIPSLFTQWLDQLYQHKQPVMIICSDKAFSHQAGQRYDDVFHLHCDGCFSSVVNGEWIRQYIEMNKMGHCFWIEPCDDEINLHTFIIVLNHQPDHDFHQHIQAWIKQTSSHWMKDKHIIPFAKQMSLPECLEWLQSHHYDPWAFDLIYPHWYALLSSHDNQSLIALNRITEQWYVLPEQTTGLRLADCYRQLHHWSQAHQCIDTYEHVNGRNFYALRERGRLFYSQGLEKKAHDLWLEAHSKCHASSTFDTWVDRVIKELT